MTKGFLKVPCLKKENSICETKNHQILKENYFSSLVETRQILELAAVKLAATRRTEKDIQLIKKAQQDYINQTMNYDAGIEENFFFHLKIVEASKNQVLHTLFLKIIPELIEYYNNTKEIESDVYFPAIRKHDKILEQIILQDENKAAQIMEAHFV